MISRRWLLKAMGVGVMGGAAAEAAYGLSHARSRPPANPPPRNERGHLLWRNWSGIEHAYPEIRLAPVDETELARAVKDAPGPIRAVGAGHSFTGLVPTDGTLVTLDRMAGIIDHDPGALTARVRAGTRLGDLGPALAAIGQAMPNLPDINKQSLAGAISTGTHGTGDTLRALHGEVTALRLVTPGGDIVTCSRARDADLFDAARVGLGAFGILVEATLRNAPRRRLHRQVWLADFQETMADWPRLVAENRNAEFYYVPFTGICVVITHNETDEPATPRPPDTDADGLMDLKALRDWLGWSPLLRRAAARAAFADTPRLSVVAEGFELLSTDRPVRFNEMEFHLPRERQMEALAEVAHALETHRPDVFFPIEARAIAPDDAWLSPFHERVSGSLAVHCYVEDEYLFLHDLVEPILRRHGGRPHWGKLNRLTRADHEALYPRFADAARLRRMIDPDDRLLNAHARRIFLGT